MLANPKSEDWSPFSLSLTDQVYFKIKELIFRQEITPGQKLQHEFLSEKLKVSTTPVREAINRLVQEGYVKNVPRKGYYLNEITTDEAEELYLFREVIELYTVEKACALRGEALIKDLKENLTLYHHYVQKPISMERLQVDKEFHVKIAEACNNRFIRNSLEQIFDRLILKRRLEGFPARGKEVYDDHEGILDSIIKQDAVKAKEFMAQHLHKGRENFMRYLGGKPR